MVVVAAVAVVDGAVVEVRKARPSISALMYIGVANLFFHERWQQYRQQQQQ